jgi:hypothetical protein
VNTRTTPPVVNLKILGLGFCNITFTFVPTAETTMPDSPQNCPRQMTTRSPR